MERYHRPTARLIIAAGIAGLAVTPAPPVIDLNASSLRAGGLPGATISKMETVEVVGNPDRLTISLYSIG